MFGEEFWRAEQPFIKAQRLSRFDVMATLTEFTAQSLALNYVHCLRSLPDLVVLCGGGAKNPALRGSIGKAVHALNSRAKIATSEAHGWPVSAIEPAAFALLAYCRWRRIPGNIATTTGAARPALLGQITEPI
jgi:anhydro-N-acetylmuramic acid kinase